MISTTRAARHRRRPAFGRATAVLVALVLAACDDGDEPAGPGATGNGSIQGFVTRQKTGEGVEGMVLALLKDGVVVGTSHSDAAGGFAFGRLAPGSYAVRPTGLELAGLDPRFVALEPPVFEVAVTDDGPADAVFAVVGLIPPRVTGDVTCGGTPVEGARVRVVGGDRDVTAATNAQGRYAALDLSAGYYAVIPVGVPCAVAPELDVVELLPGQSREVDFAG